MIKTIWNYIQFVRDESYPKMEIKSFYENTIGCRLPIMGHDFSLPEIQEKMIDYLSSSISYRVEGNMNINSIDEFNSEYAEYAKLMFVDGVWIIKANFDLSPRHTRFFYGDEIKSPHFEEMINVIGYMEDLISKDMDFLKVMKIIKNKEEGYDSFEYLDSVINAANKLLERDISGYSDGVFGRILIYISRLDYSKILAAVLDENKTRSVYEIYAFKDSVIEIYDMLGLLNTKDLVRFESKLELER